MSNKKRLVVSDASSLILLTKTTLLEIVESIFKIKIPERVFEEVVTKGKKTKREDAFIIEKEIKDKRISVLKVGECKKETKEVIKSFNLGKGERDSIVLYLQIKAELLLTDDGEAIKTAKVLKINWTNVPNLLPLLIRKNKVKKENALEALAKLQEYGRYKLDYILEVEEDIRMRKK